MLATRLLIHVSINAACHSYVALYHRISRSIFT